MTGPAALTTLPADAAMGTVRPCVDVWQMHVSSRTTASSTLPKVSAMTVTGDPLRLDSRKPSLARTAASVLVVHVHGPSLFHTHLVNTHAS